MELDGDACKNLDAFESVIRCMKEAGIGYGSVNHPVDRDPVCGFTGVIDEVCPAAAAVRARASAWSGLPSSARNIPICRDSTAWNKAMKLQLLLPIENGSRKDRKYKDQLILR